MPAWVTNKWTIIVAAIVILGLVGLAVGGGGDESAETTPTPTPTETVEEAAQETEEPVEEADEPSATPIPSETDEAVWPTLPVGDGEVLRDLIDEYAAAGNCDGMQETFDLWAGAESFPDQADILMYIDDAMTEAGCYS